LVIFEKFNELTCFDLLCIDISFSDFLSITISDYLKNKNGSCGECIKCGKVIGISRVKIASHKRSSCMKASRAERKFFGQKRKVEGTAPIYELVEWSISSYLARIDDPAKASKGTCKTCYNEVTWNKDAVAMHKRETCANASAESKSFFAKGSFVSKRFRMSDDDDLSDTTDYAMRELKIGEYLTASDANKKAGFCKKCNKSVGWSRYKLASHIRKTCPNATASEKKYFRNFRF
jgi:hypothetical protein